MNGDEIKAIYEQLDERGKRVVAVVAEVQLKYAREGLQKARKGTLNASSYNLPLEGEMSKLKGDMT